MARTQAELLAELRKNAPTFLTLPGEVADALLEAIAEILAAAEGAVGTLHDRTMLLTADGVWLDEHGRERGIPRTDGETDDHYRDRIRTIEDQVTRPAILGGVDAILAEGTARMEEWLGDGMFLDIQDLRGFTDVDTPLLSGDRGFTVTIEEQLKSRSERSFPLDAPANPFTTAEGVTYSFLGAAGDPFTKAIFLEGGKPIQDAIYADIWNLIDRIRAGGLGPAPHFRVEIE